MNFSRKTKISSEIPTSSMPDIIFMLLIFFMVTTVLREFSGLPVSLPRAERIEKLESKRHTSDIWVSKDGLISIEDKLYNNQDVRHVMYEKRASDPQLTVSLKADEAARMEIISVKAHEKALYDVYVEVLDQLKLANATRISIAETE